MRLSYCHSRRNRSTLASLAILSVTSLLCQACMQIDEGATQVRFVAPAKTTEQLFEPGFPLGAFVAVQTSSGSTGKDRLAELRPMMSRQIDPALPPTSANVVNREGEPAAAEAKLMSAIGQSEKVTDATTVSVRLVTVFLDDVLEGSRSGRSSQTQGEVAIIVNVEDLGKGSSTGFVRASEDVGRVVFYSDDVRPGQFLNVVNEPIYGPIDFSGASMRMEVLVMELDEAEEESAKSLFATLASIGATAYPPASPILGVLNAVTSTLVAARSDDIQMRFRMTLVPAKDTTAGLGRMTFQSGYYILVREQVRTKSPPWEQLRLDRRTGTLLDVTNPRQPVEYRGLSYIALQVDTGENGDRQNTEQTLAELYKAHRETPSLLKLDELQAKVGELLRRSK